jgi:hypothetical protein
MLTIEDTHGDGINNDVPNDDNIVYDVILTNDDTGDKFLLLEGNGNF